MRQKPNYLLQKSAVNGKKNQNCFEVAHKEKLGLFNSGIDIPCLTCIGWLFGNRYSGGIVFMGHVWTGCLVLSVMCVCSIFVYQILTEGWFFRNMVALRHSLFVHACIQSLLLYLLSHSDNCLLYTSPSPRD